MNRSAIVLTVVALALVAGKVLAAVPSQLTVQGKLTDAANVPFADGSYNVTFRIYDLSSSGTELWSEVSSITTIEGLFTVNLGAVTPVPDSVFRNPDRWLGIQVQGFAEMAPRTRLTSVAYANETAQWNSVGSNLSRLNGKVGIGTTNPEAKLHIGGGGAASILLDNEGDLFWKSSAGVPMPVLTLHSDDNVYLDATVASTSDLIFRTNTTLTERMRISDAGNVGIGGATFSGVQLQVSSTVGRAVDARTTALNGGGIIGVADNGTGAVGVNGRSADGYAGYFEGKVHVTGTLTKSAGSFKIDHPLDPANKSLSHSFVESPDMMNIYNGIVPLDSGGEAVVTLPDWFGALNKDFRYQLTCIGGFAPVYVAEEVINNRFRIAGGSKGMKVSWQVTGIRQDEYANAHRIPVEESKPEKERGFYMHPELFGQPEEKGIEWARRPELMKQMKDEREKQSTKSK